MSGSCKTASPWINLAAGKLGEGDRVSAVAQGECNGEHFFFEQELTIGNC
jgi:hypothetical protein